MLQPLDFTMVNKQYNIKQIWMLCTTETFDVRSTESYELSQESHNQSRCSYSQESLIMENEEISETIKELILEQKRRNFISKSQQFYEPVNLKRCQSATLIHYKKENLSLPFHLQRLLHSNRKCPNLATNDVLDSIYGAFFGFLVGDIVGAYVAYKIYNLPEIPAALLMNGGGTYNTGPGQGTDQTQILFSTAYGLMDGGSIYNSDLMARRYLLWLESKPFNVSAIFILSLIEIRKKKNQEKGISLEGLGETLKKNSQKNKGHESNLGLIRILPLVVWGMNLNDREFHRLIKDQLSLICPNELVIQTGILYAVMLRIIFRTRDQQLAFYEASKWVYSRGSQKLKQLWRYVELDIQIQSRGNTGKLKTAFSYSCIEINKRQIKFMQSLLKTLLKGGDTDANSAIVMALVGSITGYNSIPSYFKQKIMHSRMTQSSHPRNDQYSPYHVVDIVEGLMKIRPDRYVRQASKEASTAENSIIF